MTTDHQEPKKVIPIQAVPVEDSEEMVSLYAAAKKIYPRSVEGIFAYWRWITVAITQIVFYGLPWVEWGTRQAVLFDLEARRFYIFGLVLYPQDFIYLTGLLVISALSLFLFTAVAGRLWCGYACPQTVYSEIFLWIEAQQEGLQTYRVDCVVVMDWFYLCRLLHAHSRIVGNGDCLELWPLASFLGVLLRICYLR
jgi:hypothetical protein